MLYRKLFDMNWYSTEINDKNGSHCWGSISGGQRRFMIAMLGSGICDENGKPIYVGDILNSVYRLDGCKGLYEVVWIDGYIFVRKNGKHQQDAVSIFMHNMGRCKIIGNIYEDPKLLKEV